MPEHKSRQRGRPKSFYANEGQTRIQSVDRALDVLECLASGNGRTLSEIAAELDQSPATVYRILSTYQARLMVETDPDSQEWFIGPSSYRIGAAFLRRKGIVERARPAMRALMEETGETANLGAEVRGEVMFLSQVETRENIRAFFPPGSKSPMHASGIGKALLAFASEKRIADYLAQDDLEKFTERTIVDPDGLWAELKQIRSVGYSVDDEEKDAGMRCVAAPIFDHHGEVVAGISISGPSNRLGKDRIAGIGAVVLRHAQSLSTRI